MCSSREFVQSVLRTFPELRSILDVRVPTTESTAKRDAWAPRATGREEDVVVGAVRRSQATLKGEYEKHTDNFPASQLQRAAPVGAARLLARVVRMRGA